MGRKIKSSIRISSSKRSKERWIQSAIKEPGSLREWLARHDKEIERETGMKPFNKDGTINEKLLEYLERHPEVLKKISKTRWRLIWHKVHLADTLKDLRD